MAQEIYNEGRVVGFSAWELYKRLALSKGVPEDDIPSEQEWLASSIGHGASMILQIPSGATGIIDIPLPTSSTLSAAGVITANPFIGDCEYSDITATQYNVTTQTTSTLLGAGWAKKVTSYGGLINNNSSSYPSSSDVPHSDTYLDTNTKNQVLNYTKICDGIYYTKNAEWVDSVETTPTKDIDPNFSASSGVIRIYISGALTSRVQILFTGFIDKSILQGLCGYASDTGVGGSTDTTNNKWPNGGMLGPDIFPWANKIVFITPTVIDNLISSFQRSIPQGEGAGDLNNTEFIGTYTLTNLVNGTTNPNSIIDLSSIILTDYYKRGHSYESSLITEGAESVELRNNDSYSVLTAWYPGLTAKKINDLKNDAYAQYFIFPPALYAARITTQGSANLVPLDTAAPGTIKIFKNQREATAYMTMLPNNFSLYTDGDNYYFSTKNSATAVKILTGTMPTVPTKTSQLINDSGFISNKDNPITFNPDVDNYLSFRFKNASGTRNSEFLRVVNEDANGHTVGIGAGGLTFVGGGESAQTLIDSSTYASMIPFGEHLVLSADSTVYICPHISNMSEAATRKTTFRADGYIAVDKLAGSGNRLLYVDSNGIIRAKSADLVAGAGIKITGTTIAHSNSVTSGTIGSTGATSGASISIPYATYDAQGHIKTKGNRTHTVNRIQANNNSGKYLQITYNNGLTYPTAISSNADSVYFTTSSKTQLGAFAIDCTNAGKSIIGTGNYDTNFYAGALWHTTFDISEDPHWGLAPSNDNAVVLGAPSHRWYSIYAANGTIQTSDKTKKKDIDYDLDKYESLYNDLKPVSYKFIDNNSNRTHIGFISQDVEDSLNKNDLSALDFAGFCKDPKYDENDKLLEGEYEYSLRYDEFIALNTHMIQKLMKRVDALEKELEEYKNK